MWLLAVDPTIYETHSQPARFLLLTVGILYVTGRLAVLARVVDRRETRKRERMTA